jgi:hypothetical protein
MTIFNPTELTDLPNKPAIFIDPAKKEIILYENIDAAGLYSFLKYQWGHDPLGKNLPSYEFPIDAMSREMFQLRYVWNYSSGWKLINDFRLKNGIELEQ